MNAVKTEKNSERVFAHALANRFDVREYTYNDMLCFIGWLYNNSTLNKIADRYAEALPFDINESIELISFTGNVAQIDSYSILCNAAPYYTLSIFDICYNVYELPSELDKAIRLFEYKNYAMRKMDNMTRNYPINVKIDDLLKSTTFIKEKEISDEYESLRKAYEKIKKSNI